MESWNADLHCSQVKNNQVVGVHDVSSTYHVPALLESQNMLKTLRDELRLDKLDISPKLFKKGRQTWDAWKALTTSQDHVYEPVSIALVGKYIDLHDSYLSVVKSLEHAAMACARKLSLIWVDATHLEPATEVTSPEKYHKAWHEICTAQGILVPGGFGVRGTEGMIVAVSPFEINRRHSKLNGSKGQICKNNIQAIFRLVGCFEIRSPLT